MKKIFAASALAIVLSTGCMRSITYIKTGKDLYVPAPEANNLSKSISIDQWFLSNSRAWYYVQYDWETKWPRLRKGMSLQEVETMFGFPSYIVFHQGGERLSYRYPFGNINFTGEYEQSLIDHVECMDMLLQNTVVYSFIGTPPKHVGGIIFCLPFMEDMIYEVNVLGSKNRYNLVSGKAYVSDFHLKEGLLNGILVSPVTLAQALRDIGFRNVYARAGKNVDVDYRVKVFMACAPKSITFSKYLWWIIYDCLVATPALVLPVPMVVPRTLNSSIVIYDRNNRIIAVRGGHIYSKGIGFSIWGFLGAAGMESLDLTNAVASQISEMLSQP